MILDNLKDINSSADLFVYIANIEKELEQVKKHRDELLSKWGKAVGELASTRAELDETKHLLEFYQSRMTPKESQD